MRRTSTPPWRSVLARPSSRAPGMGCCSSERARSADPCRPPSTGGAISPSLCGGGLSSRVGWGRRDAVRGPVRHCTAGRGRTRQAFVLTAPVMPGAEYLTAEILRGLWAELGTALATAFIATGTDLQAFLKTLNPAWNLVGRVHFNLAENRRDPELPFAFLAPTPPACRLRARRSICRSARRCANTPALPNQRSCCRCCCRCSARRRRAVGSRRWSMPARSSIRCAGPPREAARFLNDVPDLESAGVVVRMPAHWRAGRPPRPQVTATVGSTHAIRRSAWMRCSTSAWR